MNGVLLGLVVGLEGVLLQDKGKERERKISCRMMCPVFFYKDERRGGGGGGSGVGAGAGAGLI